MFRSLFRSPAAYLHRVIEFTLIPDNARREIKQTSRSHLCKSCGFLVGDDCQLWNMVKQCEMHFLRPLKMINAIIGRADDSNFKVIEKNTVKIGLHQLLVLHVPFQICPFT